MRRIKNYTKHPFFTGSLTMLVGTNIFNVGQFVYHLLVARLLGKIYYGDLAAILSISSEVGIVHTAIGMTIVKFIASEKRKGAVNNYIKWFSCWSIWIGAATGVFALALTPTIVNFLNITQPTAVYLLAPALFVSVIVVVGRSILQGLMKFDKYVFSMMSELVARIVLTVILALAGFAVFGVMAAYVLAILLSVFVIRHYIGNSLKGKKGLKPELKPLFKFTVPVFIQGLALTSMYTVDVLMVKHFFSSDKAGLYAAMAVLGRTVFYGASPITQVMFPLISKRHARGEAYSGVFFLSAMLIVLFSALVVLAYRLFPNLAILALYGKEFLEGAPLLWWLALFMGLISIASLFVQFYLSVGKTGVVWLFALAATAQAVLIWFIHPDLLTVIKLSVLSTAFLVISLLVYFPYHKR